MKNIIKKFIFRGILVSSGGPIVYGIVMLILYLTGVDTSLNGLDVFKAIISTSLMAFLIGGLSFINQEERLGLFLRILLHWTSLYFCYLLIYLINDWIEKDIKVLLIFTSIFVITYLLIWLIVYIFEKDRINKINKNLK